MWKVGGTNIETRAGRLFHQGDTEICENLQFFEGEFPRNPYALKIQNMCIKGISRTFLTVLFLPVKPL